MMRENEVCDVCKIENLLNGTVLNGTNVGNNNPNTCRFVYVYLCSAQCNFSLVNTKMFRGLIFSERTVHPLVQ